jgi:ribosomal protein L3 glutamine methyltransferase
MPTASKSSLVTLGDFFHWAVRRFRSARLAYGHGTANAADEAAFMVLEALRLPIHDIAPWLDLEPTASERARLLTLIDARVSLRMPAPYLLGAAYMHGVRFLVDKRVLIPRSFIGELLAGHAVPLEEPHRVKRVLDLCTGSGCLAILAALAFPRARIDAVDLSAPALAVARRNVAAHRLADRIALHRGDLFEPVAGRYDLIVTNPPYVDGAGMARLPPEYRHEPRMALAAGADGLDLVRRIVDRAPRHLTSRGGLLCEVGRGRDVLERACPRLPFTWLDTETSEGEVFWIGRRDLQGASGGRAHRTAAAPGGHQIGERLPKSLVKKTRN